MTELASKLPTAEGPGAKKAAQTAARAPPAMGDRRGLATGRDRPQGPSTPGRRRQSSWAREETEGPQGLPWEAKGRGEVFDNGRTHGKTPSWPGCGGAGQVPAPARAHPQHPVQLLDLPGFLLRQEEREAVGGPHAGHTLAHGSHRGALHQGVPLIRMEPLGHQREVQGFQQDLRRGWGASEGPAGARGWPPGPHTPLTLMGSQPRKEARKLELLDRSHSTPTPGGKLAPTQPETPTATATKSRLSPWARGAHQAGSSRLRRPSASPTGADGPVRGSPRAGAGGGGSSGTQEHTCVGELSRLGLLPRQTRAGQPQRLCPLPGGAGPEAQEWGAPALTCQGSRGLQLLSLYGGGQPPPTGSGGESAAPHLGGHGARLGTPPATLRRGPDTCPAPQAANPHQPVFPAPPTSCFLHQERQSSPLRSATWSMLTAMAASGPIPKPCSWPALPASTPARPGTCQQALPTAPTFALHLPRSDAAL